MNMNHSDSNSARPFIHIKPKKGWQLIDFRELKEYRDLFYFLVVRDIKLKYKQTVLGGLWAVIQPFFSMVVFTLFFGKLARVPSDGIPYPIFNYRDLCTTHLKMSFRIWA
jgi:lipopolysaccharide transport system permease protein